MPIDPSVYESPGIDVGFLRERLGLPPLEMSRQASTDQVPPLTNDSYAPITPQGQMAMPSRSRSAALAGGAGLPTLLTHVHPNHPDYPSQPASPVGPGIDPTDLGAINALRAGGSMPVIGPTGKVFLDSIRDPQGFFNANRDLLASRGVDEAAFRNMVGSWQANPLGGGVWVPGQSGRDYNNITGYAQELKDLGLTGAMGPVNPSQNKPGQVEQFINWFNNYGGAGRWGGNEIAPNPLTGRQQNVGEFFNRLGLGLPWQYAGGESGYLPGWAGVGKSAFMRGPAGMYTGPGLAAADLQSDMLSQGFRPNGELSPLLARSPYYSGLFSGYKPQNPWNPMASTGSNLGFQQGFENRFNTRPPFAPGFNAGVHLPGSPTPFGESGESNLLSPSFNFPSQNSFPMSSLGAMMNMGHSQGGGFNFNQSGFNFSPPSDPNQFLAWMMGSQGRTTNPVNRTFVSPNLSRFLFYRNFP